MLYRAAWLAVAGALAIAAPAHAQGRDGPEPVFVQAAARTTFVDRVEALGTLRAKDTVSLTATVTDTVTGIYFDDGVRVSAGDTLLTMADGEVRAQLEEANAEVEESRSQYERARSLVDQGTVSRSVLDERRRAYDTAVARRRAIQSRLEDRVITAPFDGVVGLRRISTGALVSPGDVITRIHDDSVMKLDFPVPSTFLDALAPGIRIVARARALEGREFRGEISSLDNEIDPVTRSIVVRALLPNEDRSLKPGLLMSVELMKNPREAVAVPEGAIVPLARDTYVFVVADGPDGPVAQRRRIETGTRRPGAVEVTSGLAPGELVVIHGTLRLRPGQPIEIRAEARGGETLEELLGEDAATRNLGG